MSSRVKILLYGPALGILLFIVIIAINIVGNKNYSGPTKSGIADAQIRLLNSVLNEYCSEFGSTSTDGKQLASALTGHNSKQKIYLESWGLPHNAAGEFIDPWGEPFKYERDGQTIVASTRRKLWSGNE